MTRSIHARHHRRLSLAALPILACFSLLFSGCGSVVASGRNSEGVKLFQQSQYDQALRQFQEASYADAANADAYYNQAATYHRLGKMNNAQGDLQKAETYYNLCLDRNNNHAECYRGLAVLLAEEGRSQEAFRLVEGWVAQQPTSADAKIELARLCEEFGDRNSAKEHLVEALTIQPDNPRALAALEKSAKTRATRRRPWPITSARSGTTATSRKWPRESPPCKPPRTRQSSPAHP